MLLRRKLSEPLSATLAMSGWRAGSSAPTSAPALISSLDFGRLTLTGAGGTPIATSGTAITSASINSGTNSNHWQITSAGIITPSATGVGAGLSGSYTLNVTATNAAGSAVGSITITTEAAAYDVASTAEATAAFAAAGAVSVATRVWFRAGNTFTLTNTWFNSRAHTALLTIQSRTPWYSGTPAIIDTVGNVAGTAWTNLKFKDLKWTCRFLRATYGNTTYVIVIGAGAWGKVEWEDCDIAGDVTTLGPGQHFKGFIGVSNVASVILTATDIQINGTEPISSGLRLKSRLHGMWRMVNFLVGASNTGPGLRAKITNTDVYDMGLDGIYIANVWTNVDVSSNYIHSPYIDRLRVAFDDAVDDVFVRSTAWAGAADGKKLFMVWAGQFQATAATADCIYAQGTTADPRVKLVRNSAGNMVCTVANPAGANVVTLTSAATYSGASFKLVVAVSIDTDSHARMYIWKEQDGGGGVWTSAASAVVAGETLNLNSGPVQLAGTETKTEKFEGYYTRYFTWYGVSPDLTSSAVRDQIVDSATGRDVAASVLIAAYGTPVLQQEGVTAYWNSLSSAAGTGGNWTDIGQVEIDHGDLIQTAPNATVTGWNMSDNILSSGFDVSADYERPANQVSLYKDYYEMQGIFLEDINSNNYLTAATIDRNIIMAASGHGISAYNAKDAFIRDNVLIVPDDWGYTSANYPAIKSQAHGTAPNMGGNTVTNNWSYSVSLTVGGSGSANITTPANVGASVTPANYSAHMAAGAAPTTRAQIVAFVAGAL